MLFYIKKVTFDELLPVNITSNNKLIKQIQIMDKQVKQRLKAAVSLEGLTNKEIAEKTDYSERMVSLSLNPKHDVLTDKFLGKLFTAYPEFALKHKDSILNGTDNQNLFNNAALNEELVMLRAENKALKEAKNAQENTIKSMQLQMDKLWKVLEKAIGMHPDIAKLLNPLAIDTQLGAELTHLLVGSQGDFKRDFVKA